MGNLLVKDDKVWISFYVCVPYKWERREYESARKNTSMKYELKQEGPSYP
jgi:hypothetical protein